MAKKRRLQFTERTLILEQTDSEWRGGGGGRSKFNPLKRAAGAAELSPEIRLAIPSPMLDWSVMGGLGILAVGLTALLILELWPEY
ncbi:MAG: hypothetical protein HQL52_13750 [Magnetococcales bacterium]|nr:hypothetical protein [Magnetococcales bacterium]